MTNPATRRPVGRKRLKVYFYRAISVAIGVLVGLVLAVKMRAETSGVTLFGQVSEHGAPVSGAVVTLGDGRFLQSVNTNSEGRYTFSAVPSGRYELRTSAHGYAVFERSVTIRSDKGHPVRVDVRDLLPSDQQTVSLNKLADRKLAQN
jgi:hypothetical protein